MANLFKLVEEAAKVKGELKSNEVNKAIANIQDALGQDDGGFAGIYFSDYEANWHHISVVEKIKILSEYVAAEIRWLAMEV
ncbi:hypothetical protein KI655_18575 [Vibrio sp. D404a]|uniref:hypothetical protein n=1 Tax=unclassified Vibrio TaxID=2614977 RepID=UPI002554EAE7|nr:MULTISPECIES: hypothetical protein [unclassified Vibrio]MDK9739304.1 hypothetical protein [Vibrio sp. D404a]MDK9797660.1 hypothetical protein [Vibrio sp. D449a]